ncbi:MAG: phosphotransferase [Deltaproteobacteria bacterium]|nr:phosphotransferase [Deltaproteobacteria bacterium]
MTSPWTPERTLTIDEARALAGRHVPARTLVRLGSGWDNDAWLVDGEWVFRFPRRAFAVPFLEREIAVLPALAPLLPLPITNPEHAGRDEQGWPYAGYRFTRGRIMATADDEPDVIAGATLGRFVRALHEVRGLAARLGGDTLKKVDVRARLEPTLALARAAGVALPQAIIDAALAVPTAGRLRVVTHGDLDGRHVLVDAGVVTGIIDWGDVHLGDPATDLALAWSALDGDARRAFLEAYGEVPGGDDTLALARFRALHVALHVVSWATDIADADALRGGRRAIERALAAV